MTVIHITNGHCAFDDRIFYKELRSLSKQYECYELCGTKDGKTLATMGGDRLEEGVYDGITVIPFKSGSQTPAGRIKRILFPVIYASLSSRVEAGRILRILTKRRIHPDVIHFHDIGFTSSALILKKAFSCRLVFDSHEFFFSYPFSRGLNCLTCLLASRMLLLWKKAIKASDFTISCTKTMDNLVSIIRQDDSHGIVYNSSIFAQESQRRSISGNGKVILVHEGMMPFNRGLKLMVEMFRDEYVREHFRLQIVGTVKGEEKAWFEQKCREYNISEENICFTGWVDYLDVPKALQGDVGILFFEKSFNTFYGMPNKLFTYHVTGLPVLSTHCADLSDTIRQLGTGVTVERSVESVKQGLMKLVEHYGEYQSHVLEHQKEFHWSNDEGRLLKIYEGILA